MRTKLLMLLALLGVIVAFSGLLQADAVIYEPFDYPVGGLDGQGDPNQVGLEGTWNAQASAMIVADSLTYGSLPTIGGSMGGLGGGSNHFGGARAISADALAGNGLLDDGATLWFSLEMGYDVGGNVTNSRLVFALANDSFNAGNYNYWIDDDGEQLGSGLGVILGRLGSNGRVAAAQFRDLASGDAMDGNILGSLSDSLYGEGEHGLIIGKIVWGADSDTIELYTPDTSMNLGDPISTLTVSVDQLTFDTISWARGDKVVMDEIRFGENYAAVLGERGPTNLYPPDQSTVLPGDVEMTWGNISAADPNAPVFVDVWFGTDPCETSPTFDFAKVVTAGEDVESYLVTDLAIGTYFWRVDTYINGSALINDDNKITGAQLTFNNDIAPEIDAGVDMVTWSGQGVEMAPGIVDDGVSTVTYLWTVDPDGNTTYLDGTDDHLDVVISDATAENPTITITKTSALEPLLLDGSFEFNELGDGGWDTTPAPHWIDGQYVDPNNPVWQVVSSGSGVGDPDTGDWASGTSYDGENYFMANSYVGEDSGLFQTLSSTLEADADYEINLMVGNYDNNVTEANPTGAAGNYRIELLAGGVVIASVSGASPVSGTWAPAALSHTSDAAPAQLGQALEIRILAEAYGGADGVTNGVDICFDAVTFTVNGDATHTVPPQEGQITAIVTVAVSDENNPTPVVDTMTIDVYDTACQATRDGGNQSVNNLTDIDGDCVTNLKDFAAMAAKWLIDTSSTGPVDL